MEISETYIAYEMRERVIIANMLKHIECDMSHYHDLSKPMRLLIRRNITKGFRHDAMWCYPIDSTEWRIFPDLIQKAKIMTLTELKQVALEILMGEEYL